MDIYKDLIIDYDSPLTISLRTSQRQFVYIPGKFTEYGFGKLNHLETVCNKLKLRQFTYEITRQEFTLIITLNRIDKRGNEKIANVRIEFKEVFHNPNEERELDELSNEELKQMIILLKNKVNHMESVIETMKEKEDLAENIYYSDCSE
jgi:hypothetical protein